MTTLLAFILLPIDSPPAPYVLLFGVLVFSGIGLPVPEEVTLVFGGYLAYLEFIEFWPAVYVLIAGIMAADIGGYLMGRYAGVFLARLITSWRPFAVLFEKVSGLFERHGDKIVLFSRPLMGIRVAVPVFAGYTKMRFWKFLLLDLAAAAPWTFSLVFVSYYLGSGFDLITEIREIKLAFFVVLGLAIILFTAVRFLKSGKRASVV